MPRQINQVIQVTLVRDDTEGELRPAAFTWRRQRFTVTAVQDRWEEQGRWWEREPGESVWRLFVQRGGLVEVSRINKEPPEWRLRVIYD